MSVGQRAFAEAVLAPGRPVPQGLSAPGGRPAGKRFDVYRNNVVLSLTEALAVAFPAVRKLLGEAAFTRMAGVFVRAHPPETPVLMLYGGALPEFLRGFGPLAHLGYLPDVAALEQAMRGSYHAADAEPVAPERLAGLAPEALTAARLRLAPAVRVLRSSWPVHAIWRYNMEDGAPKPAMRPEDVAIFRPAFDPEPQCLLPGDAAFLQAIAAGHSIGAAYEAALAEAPGFDLATLLGRLLSGRAITAVET